MVVLSRQVVNEQLSSIIKNYKSPSSFFPCNIPLIDISKPESKNQLVKACEEFGFFKVVNHGVPMEFITKLELEAIKFFSSPVSQKEKTGPLDPFGYGNKKIGPNGDVGWVEYILLSTNSEFNYQKFASILGVNPKDIRDAVNDYVLAMKKMACEILEMLAEGLKIHPKNVFSKLLMDSTKMIYFGGPPLGEKIAPLASLLIKGNQDSLYKEFTWFEYKKSAYKSRLADNRLVLFEKEV